MLLSGRNLRKNKCCRLSLVGEESFEEVVDDCDDKEYECHGVPSEAGVSPVFDVILSHIVSQKRPATSRHPSVSEQHYPAPLLFRALRAPNLDEKLIYMLYLRCTAQGAPFASVVTQKGEKK